MSTPFTPLPGGLRDAWREASPNRRLEALRTAAARTRDALLEQGPALASGTFKLVTFPYPTVYAFAGGARAVAPYVMMTNRMQIVQFEDGAGVRRTLLFNPTDPEGSRAAPFYADLARRFGEFLSRKVVPTYFGTVESHLAAAGLTASDVDYIAYDHLHVQDLRKWLGPAGLFPRARLLVMGAEWDEVHDLHPMSMVWYVPSGCAIDPGRVIRLDGDTLLGRGVALVDTRGHTAGNMSLCVVTPDGPFVVSENGVAPENYVPLQSEIPGLRGHAEQMGYEVILNGNTREGSLDQYSSMVVEKTLAGPAPTDPAFPAFAASSELTASLFAPGLSPTFTFTPRTHGVFTATRGEPS